VVHPKNKAERLLNEQKKERRRQLKEDRASAVRAKLALEALKIQETQHEIQSFMA
jgi:hypothetical protein